ncbi:MAG: patatin-like phospholipase family protein [Cyanobacteria bacterium SZAS LIN-3]|nr:patatin-like phospholipase family protein [Cyanobacteria bacterium SZAS LIN-3]MBS2007401.1 patatin-like phospholipase family protein [Cyanobacteria bacterium SZAS TMP-1]
MSTNTNNPRADGSQQADLHLLISSGGSRAILAGAGTILLCDHAGIKNWKSIGGISGGSLPTALYAAGHDARTSVKIALDVDFSSLLTRRGSILKILFAYLMQSRYEKTRPKKGVLSSEKVGTYVEDQVAAAGTQGWPSLYWTQAGVEDGQLVYTSTGIHHIKRTGSYRLLMSEPGPLGIAVRGSCAVPGIIDAVPVQIGKDHFWLHDGVLSPEGRTPVSIPERFFGAKPSQIIVCDVGESDGSRETKKTKAMIFWRWFCGKLCIPEFYPEPLDAEDGYIICEPTVTNFKSLQFTLTRDQKWQAVMSGYMGAAIALEKANLLTGDALKASREICAKFQEIVADCEARKKTVKEGELTARTEELLKSYGLW